MIPARKLDKVKTNHRRKHSLGPFISNEHLLISVFQAGFKEELKKVIESQPE